jgi:hypothetical protein
MKRHILELIWVTSVAACVGIGCIFLTEIIGQLAGLNLRAENGMACGFMLCLAAFIFRKWHRMFPSVSDDI